MAAEKKKITERVTLAKRMSMRQFIDAGEFFPEKEAAGGACYAACKIQDQIIYINTSADKKLCGLNKQGKQKRKEGCGKDGLSLFP